MPPLPSLPNVARFVLHGVVDNISPQVWANVLYWAFSGTPPTDADLATLATQVAGDWVTYMAPESPSPTKLTSVQITDLSSPSAGQGEWLGSHPGTRGDDSIPASACVLIHYPTTFRYKGGHPRTYLMAGGNADFQGATEWSTLFRSEVEQHWRDFLGQVTLRNVGGMQLTSPGSVRYHGKFLPNDGAPHYRLINPIFMPHAPNSGIADLVIASQRGRVRGIVR